MLTSRGFECEVFLCAAGHGDVRELHKIQGVLVRELGEPNSTPFDDVGLPDQVQRHLRSAWQIADNFASESTTAPFDVVQVPNYGVSGLFIDVPVPMVMRFSSHAPTWFAAEGSSAGMRTLMGGCVEQMAVERADFHFAPSRFVADRVTGDTGIPVEIVRPPAPNPTEHTQWDEAWVAEVVDGRPYLVHAGQLSPLKGTDLVIAAMAKCLQTVPDVALHLCGRVVGIGSSIRHLEDEFPGRVLHHGRVSPDRLHPLMAGALGVLAPSRADNLPNVVIEAMQIGVPVIGVNGASIDELIIDGRSGILAKPESAEALASCVMRLVSMSPSERRAIGQVARRRILTALDEEACIGSLIEIYGRACQVGVRNPEPRCRVAQQVLDDLEAMNGRTAFASRRMLLRRLVRRFDPRRLRRR